MNNYTKLAEYYDFMQQDIDYTVWKNFTLSHIPKGSKILEIGCGTGKFAGKYINDDYQIDAFDLSEGMIKVAKKNYPQINFYVDDIRSFITTTKYDAVICYMDTINYLVTSEDLKAAFKQVSKALNPNGLFLFDLHRTENLENFDEYLEAGYIDDLFYEWESKVLSYDTGIVTHRFLFKEDDIDIQELHTQKIMDVKFYQDIFTNYFKQKKHYQDEYREYFVLSKEE